MDERDAGESVESAPRVLCYPNFNLNDLEGIKHSLLICHRVSVIAPTMTPYYQVPMIDAGLVEREPTKIMPYGALQDFLDECRLEDGKPAVDLIDDYEIVQSRAAEFKRALQQDLHDPDVDAWENRWRARHPQRDYAWYISSPYFTELLDLDVHRAQIQATFNLATLEDERFGELVKVPFRMGMSLGVSEALWAALDNDCSLFTLDPTSADFLMLRLRRGLSTLADDPRLRRELNLDLRVAKEFAASGFSAWTLAFAVPQLFQRIPQLSLAEVMQLRRQSDTTEALAKFRHGVASIVAERGLWKAQDFQTFRREAEHAADLALKPALEALEQKPLDVKDIVTAFDLSSAAGKLVEAIPKLFISGATGATVAGAVALAGATGIVPAALFGLGCGLVGDAVAELINMRRERLAQRRHAEFLTYTAGLRDALA